MTESNLNLSDSPSLRDLQEYVKQMTAERGFDHESVTEKFVLMMEEVGELAKAVRKTQGMHIDLNSQKYRPDHEAADVLMYLLDICNRLGIDLEKALREKEEINKRRTWSAALTSDQAGA
jgi:NTP pyrophosphatase (non-canonical NTP hydrolase)